MMIAIPSGKKERLGLALLLILVVVTSIIGAVRAQHGSNDYDTFYAAGHAVWTGEGIYYQGEYYETPGNRGPFLYAPAAALFFALLAWLPMGLAAVAYNILLFVLLAGCVFFILRLLEAEPPKEFLFRIWREDRAAAAGALALSAAFALENITMEQANIVVFFLCLAGLALGKAGKPWRAGLPLGLAALFKLTPVLFLFYFAARRQWRILISMALSMILFSLVIPTLVFGPSKNRLYHQQWLGRMIKPSIVSLQARGREETHPLKKKAEQYRFEALGSLLNEMNQALPGALTRLFLKDRNLYGHTGSYPIPTATRYEKLPVIAGGLPLEALSLTVKAVTGVLFLLWLGAAVRSRRETDALALTFLSLTLLSPLARSHQFVAWMFPLAAWFTLPEDVRKGKMRFLYTGGCALYLLQGLPLASAAGFGAWSNFCFWCLFFMAAGFRPQDAGKADRKPGF